MRLLLPMNTSNVLDKSSLMNTLNCTVGVELVITKYEKTRVGKESTLTQLFGRLMPASFCSVHICPHSVQMNNNKLLIFFE